MEELTIWVEVSTGAVECCPHCDSENEYLNYNAKENGYIARCQHCGKEIFLCDECMHAEDNPEMLCDWEKLPNGCGKCFRGMTRP